MKNKLLGILFSILLLFTACNKGEEGQLSSKKAITSFVLEASKNGLKSNIVGKINQVEGIITMDTQQWINAPEALVATITAEGVLSVNGVEQVNATTTNNFKNDVVYTATAEDGTKATYTVKLRCPQTSGLAVLKVDIEGNKEITEKTDEYYKANLKLIDSNPLYCFEKQTGIRGRGNLTWSYPKKPYRLKFDEKTSMFGLGAEKSWVLLANYQDPTVLTSDIAFELARRTGLAFTNHSHFVELFVNGTYRGNYQLTEQVQEGGNRVAINKKTGFLVEIDVYYDEDWQFKTNHIKLPVMVKEPDMTSTADMEYIKKAVQDFEDALFGDPNFPNNNYQDLVDINSLINFLIVNEITRNQELRHPKSTYAYKLNKDSKICFGPVWDFDWGFGYAGSGHTYFTCTDMLFYKGSDNGTQVGSKFFARFFDDPAFCAQYKHRWNQLKSTQFNSIVEYVEVQGEKLKKSQVENYKRWNNYAAFTYTSEIVKMKNWLRDRIEFLDGEINKF